MGFFCPFCTKAIRFGYWLALFTSRAVTPKGFIGVIERIFYCVNAGSRECLGRVVLYFSAIAFPTARSAACAAMQSAKIPVCQ